MLWKRSVDSLSGPSVALEIKKEVAKSLATKTLNIPRSVAAIIRAVHFERTHTLKQIRRENELAAIEYRKWMIECKQKTKREIHCLWRSSRRPLLG